MKAAGMAHRGRTSALGMDWAADWGGRVVGGIPRGGVEMNVRIEQLRRGRTAWSMALLAVGLMIGFGHPGIARGQWTTSGTSIYYNTGSVGIGTTNPLASLHVAGVGPGNPGSLKLQNRRGRTWQLGEVRTAGKFEIYDIAVGSRLTIDSVGNVGIGTASPTAVLNVVGNNPYGVLNVRNNTATNYATALIEQTTAGGNGNQDIGLVVAIQGAATTDRIVNFQDYNSGTPISRFAVTKGGNVGIGTTGPNSKLHLVDSTLYSPPNQYGVLRAQSTYAGTGSIIA